MEVDLTDDDLIMTTPLPLHTPKLSAPIPVRNQPKEKEKQKNISNVETVEIDDDDDDDDVIFVETSVPPTEEKQNQDVTTNASSKSKVSESKQVDDFHNGDVMEVDQVVKAVASICPTEQRAKSNSNQSADVSDQRFEAQKEIAQDAAKPPHESGSKFVVDISDDDFSTTGRKRKVENNCLNVCCKSGDDLALAPMFVVSYFGCKLKKGRHEVCAECHNIAVNHHKELAERLFLRKPLLSYENFPKNDIPVVDLESDEETSDPEDPLPFSLLQDVERNLEQVIEDSIRKCDLDYQVKEATGILSEKLTSLELGSKESDETFCQFQKEIDRLRTLVYIKHEPIRRELPSLELTAYTPPPMPSPQEPLFRVRPQQQQQQQLEQRPYGVAMKRVTHVAQTRPPAPRSDVSNQEVVAVAQVNVPQTPLPPMGALLRPKPRQGDVVYVMKMSFFGVWLRGRVMDVINETHMVQTVYKVKMEIQANRKQFSIKTVPGRHMAYPNPATVRLAVGTRVIAVFQDDESNNQNSNQNKGGSYYSGLIAEPPKSNNRFRYLVFFDDGYAQYVPHNKILVVCESSRNVWDDIHPDSCDFIRKYLEQYPERPMVKLAPNQVVKTEWNGKWWIARVVEVDGSLVKMSFDADGRTEWIYRGSTRLAPLYTELAQAQARLESGGTGTISRMRGMGVRRVNQPYVEYTQNIGVEDDLTEPTATQPTAPRAVAKKSTSKKQETHVSPVQSSRIAFFDPSNIGKVKEMQLPKDAPMPKRYQPHTCGFQCIDWIKYDRLKMCGYNPLSIPLYCGWQRELLKFRKNKNLVMYTAPCGRRLRTMDELHRYLRKCKSDMSVDLFEYDHWVNALSEFTLSDRMKVKQYKEDISDGKENVKIPWINYVDYDSPTHLNYQTQRQPYDGVPLNVDPQFLCGCDCTDDCQNKEKCACWQLTIQGTALYPGGVLDPSVGYYYKRLQDRVITGIYECNSQCKCSKKTCLNRVVQHPLQLQLQLFKTPTKGWGLRCVNDIPKGTFICIYAGYLYTEQTANAVGEREGDDYLAELDYIEVVERMKEDYESDVEDEPLDEDEDSEKLEKEKSSDDKRNKNRNKEEVDEDYKIGWRSASGPKSDASIRSRLRKRTSAELDSTDDSKNEKASKRRESSHRSDDGSDDDKLERQPSSFTPKPLKKPSSVEEPIHRFQSVRKFYGPNERVYIMDANKVGNIGRYMNHSCNPNVFVQNVFVDTHDLRFPWVAFFALSYVKAGTELTWDYNYEVGSVPDKQIICRCGSEACRGRLL